MFGHGTKVAFMLLCCMKTIKDVSTAFKQGLISLYATQEIEAITLMVLTEITASSKAKVKAFPEKELSAGQSENLFHILSRLKTGEPIQYILGYTEFYGLTFKVNPSVLIPRPETEELVEWVLSEVKNQKSKVKILDIGTGSGCIAISLKKNLPGANVSAIDISPGALQTTKENAELNEVDIDFIEADILSPNSLSHISDLRPHISIIISNPPYVTLDDKKQMHTNVTSFEPHTALFVPENDPLIFYKAIADFAADNLIPDGMLFFEINENLGKETVELLTGKGFKNIELRKDMSGRDRMIKATKL
jgi:release factor glutamine methyltransferase